MNINAFMETRLMYTCTISVKDWLFFITYLFIMFRKDRDKKSRSRSPKRDKRKDSSSKSPRRSRDKSKDRSNRESSDKGSPPQGDQEQILDEIRPSYSRSRSRSAPRSERSHRSERSPRSERSARSGTRSPRADREDNEEDWGGRAGR